MLTLDTHGASLFMQRGSITERREVVPLTPDSERQLSVLQFILNRGGWVSCKSFASWNVAAQGLYSDVLAAIRAEYVTQEGIPLWFDGSRGSAPD